jgi:hypothetical protein
LPHRDENATLHELFARMVFNVLVGNTDDHARNHAAYWDGEWLALTPAYDICPQARTGREANQAMSIDGDDRRSRLEACRNAAARFLLSDANDPGPLGANGRKVSGAGRLSGISEVQRQSARCRRGRKLESDQISELGRDIGHAVFRCAKAVARCEHGADFAQRLEVRAVHDGNDLALLQENRKLLIGDTFASDVLQEVGRHQHDPNPRLRQPSVDLAEERHAKPDIFFAKPDFDALRL